MKKLLIVALSLIALATPQNIKAQDVLKELLKTNTAICNDTTKEITLRKKAIFKVDELKYMQGKAFLDIIKKQDSLELINSKIKILNEQSLAMYEFCNLYEKRLQDSKKRNRSIVKQIFKQTTIEHPLFNEEDQELNRSYYDREDYPYQFALDCDWVRALYVIRMMDWSKF